MNKTPQVLLPSGTGVHELPILSDPSLVRVLVNDPEEDVLTFVWEVPRANSEPQVVQAPQENGDMLSTLSLPSEWVKDGDVIKVFISDEAEPPNLLSVQWRVAVEP